MGKHGSTRLGHVGLTADQALAQINHIITQQSTLLAANDIFWISVWFAGKSTSSGLVATH